MIVADEPRRAVRRWSAASDIGTAYAAFGLVNHVKLSANLRGTQIRRLHGNQK